MASGALPSTFTSLNPCNVDSPGDIRCKLMYTSMELQKVRAEGRIQEAELWRLQELLSIIIKERDEAREECRKLQEILLQQTPAVGVHSASSFMHSSSMVSSPSSSPWSLQELEEHLNSDDFCPPVGAPTPFELQQALESLVQSWDKSQLFSHMKPGNESARQTAQQEIQMETLNHAFSFDGLPCMISIPELQQVKDESWVSTGSASIRSLSRQSSSNSSSLCVQSSQREQVSMESLSGMTTLSSGAAELSPAAAVTGVVSSVPCPPPSMGCNVSYPTQQILPFTSVVGSNGATKAIENLPPVQLTAPINYNATVSDNLSWVTNHALPPRSIECKNGALAAIDVSPQLLCMGNDRLPTNTNTPCSMPGNAEAMALLINTSAPATGSNNPSLVSNGPIGAGKNVANQLALSTAKNVPFSASSSTANSHSLVGSAPLGKVLSTGPIPASKSTAVSSMFCHQQAILTPVRQFHLPEPPEADPQVMLNSLPEKGKLLQAVMQAGPLLQTLLLAGPLPQWRYPPPALSMRDIPKVSLVPGHTVLTPAGIQGAAGGSSSSSLTISRKRTAIAPESCFQNKKLRKIGPSPVKKSQAILCTAPSGGSKIQELAAG